MYASYVSYFNIVVPATTFLLGALLIACWLYIKEQKELLWIAAGYIMPATVLAIQSGLNNEALAKWAIFTAPIYVGGAWCISRGIALRYKAKSHPLIALALVVACSSLLYYYSRVEDNLWLRIIVLNSAILLTQLLAIPSVLMSTNVKSSWDRLLLLSFLLFSALILCRIVIVVASDPMTNTDLLTQSPYWRLLLTSSLFFSLWFVTILLGATMAQIVKKLKLERDHDPLTGLLNRRAFFERAEKQLSRADNRPIAIIALDIDHFKAVNDTYGHAAGDDVLRHFAQELKTGLHGQELISRFGGEEFVAMLINTDVRSAYQNAVKIQQSLIVKGARPGSKSITASIGITQIDECDRLDNALKYADQALYHSKLNGRDQISIYERVQSPQSPSDMLSA